MKKLSAILFLTLATCTWTSAQSADPYVQTLSRMFEVSGTENVYKSVITQVFGMFKQQYSQVDPTIWEELEAEFMQTSMDEIVEMLVPVYEKHLSQDDLQTVIDFYMTDIGKKFAEKTPLITQESMQIGQAWGQKIGEEFAKKMEERGYE